MKQIILTKGHVAIVDDRWFEYLSQWAWDDNQGYAVRFEGPRLHRKMISMHRVIMNAPEGMDVDHIDTNRLNNPESNLRLCTRAENSRNQSPRIGGTSQYKGVSWYRQSHKWTAQIRINRKGKHLGYFTDEIEAALAYDDAARRLFGEFARTNFDNTGVQ